MNDREIGCGATGPEAAEGRRLGGGEASVIIVVVLLAGVLAAFGMPLSDIMAVLGGAGLTAAAVVAVSTRRVPWLQVLPAPAA